MKLNFQLRWILFCGIGLVCSQIFGHDVPVHENITMKAAESAYQNSSAYTNFVSVMSSDFPYSGALVGYENTK